MFKQSTTITSPALLSLAYQQLRSMRKHFARCLDAWNSPEQCISGSDAVLLTKFRNALDMASLKPDLHTDAILFLDGVSIHWITISELIHQVIAPLISIGAVGLASVEHISRKRCTLIAGKRFS